MLRVCESWPTAELISVVIVAAVAVKPVIVEEIDEPTSLIVDAKEVLLVIYIFKYYFCCIFRYINHFIVLITIDVLSTE